MTARIHQIFYSEKTRAENDPGFLPLDYLSNDRPDWREYWPMRRYLLNSVLEEDVALGFLSPKFAQKTGLTAEDVHRFIAQADAEVYLFPPFFDQSALFLNVFEQAGVQHPGLAPLLVAATAVIEPAVPATQLLMNSTNTVFCNFIVAKPRFWRVWLAMCERLFAVAEEGTSELARALNASTDHLGGAAPAKVFVIERVASLLLTMRRDYRVRVFDPMALPMALPAMRAFSAELCTLDALKIAHSVQPRDAYLSQFSAIRQQVVQAMQAPT